MSMIYKSTRDVDECHMFVIILEIDVKDTTIVALHLFDLSGESIFNKRSKVHEIRENYRFIVNRIQLYKSKEVIYKKHMKTKWNK